MNNRKEILEYDNNDTKRFLDKNRPKKLEDIGFGSVNLIVAKSVFFNIFIEPYFHKAVQVIFRLKAV